MKMLKKMVMSVALLSTSLMTMNAYAFNLGDVIGVVKDQVSSKTSASGENAVYSSDEKCLSMVPSGAPASPKADVKLIYLCHQGYVLGYNRLNKTPTWVGEYLTRANLDTKNAQRNDNFRPDPMLTDINPSYSATLKDYAGSSRVGAGFDRGHMAPAEDFRKYPDQMDESFYLTNMVPQNSNNNRGVWAALEKNVRYWAQKYEAAEVVTGPIYYNGRTQGKLGSVAIPTHLYKVIYLPTQGKAIGFILPNSPVDKSALGQYAMSVSDAEKLSGMTFFPRLSESIKAKKPTDLQIFDR